MSPFLAWGDFHARSRFAHSTIPEGKWGTARSLDRKWTFCIILRWFCPNFAQVASFRVKKVSNTHLLASRHVKREKTSLPIDMRHSKTPLLQGVPLLLLLSIEKISFSQSSSSWNPKVFINSLLIKPNFFALHSSIIYSSLLFICCLAGRLHWVSFSN